MLFIEIVVLTVGIFFGAGILVLTVNHLREKYFQKGKIEARMVSELDDVLRSKDYVSIDVYLVKYNKYIDKNTKKILSSIRDDLFLRDCNK